MPCPRCSLIVPVYNGLEFLRPMLESLRQCTSPHSYELILSDDGSTEETRSFLRELEGASVHLAEENGGFAKACNAGARMAKGEFLVFLNSDLEFRAGWLEQLLQTADEDERIGAVGCKLLYPDGTIQHGGVFLREDQLDRVPLIASHDHVGKPGDAPDASQRADLLAVTAAALLIRRTAFDQAGGFDEGYVNGYEDVDLCLKLGRAGWRVVYDPACTLIHHESKSGAKRFAFSKENQRRFLDKWLGRVRPEVLVTPHCDVLPHPDFLFGTAFEHIPLRKGCGVSIVVLPNGPLAATALTLESIYTARIALQDEVISIAAPGDADGAVYFSLCEQQDDAFTWGRNLPEVIGACGKEVIAFVEAGAVVTQGWLSRMLPWLERHEVGAVGPLLSGVSGPQDAMSLIQEGQGGTFFPTELSHAFAKALRGQGTATARLNPSCFLVRAETARNLLSNGARDPDHILSLLIQSGLSHIAANDVFVHLEPRFQKQEKLALAA